jgi:hypothetical protein
MLIDQGLIWSMELSDIKLLTVTDFGGILIYDYNYI